MLLSKWAVFDSKESRFVKEQEASELLCGLDIRTHLSQMLLAGDCNWTQTHNHLVYKWTLNHLTTHPVAVT